MTSFLSPRSARILGVATLAIPLLTACSLPQPPGAPAQSVAWAC